MGRHARGPPGPCLDGGPAVHRVKSALAMNDEVIVIIDLFRAQSDQIQL